MSTRGQDEISCQGMLELKKRSAKPVDLLVLGRIKVDQTGVPPCVQATRVPGPVYRQRFHNPADDVECRADGRQFNLWQVTKMDCSTHDEGIPNQATFRLELNASSYGDLYGMAQVNGRKAVSSENETQCPGRMMSLGRGTADGLSAGGV